MDAFTPAQTMELISRVGAKKSKMRFDKLCLNSFLAGPLLGFGCAITLSTNAAPWYQDNAPGLIRTIAASFFPIGLILVILTGADLFTSNVMFLPVAFLHRRVTLFDIGKSMFVSFFGNLAGMLFFMAIIVGYGGVFEHGAYKAESITFAIGKAVTPHWHQIFLKAIGANWLVCLAVFMAISSREIGSKILAIWWPITTFVALGMDHVIANMFLIPMGIWNGAPITVGYYIWKSMIPAFLGNTLGAALFVGTAYWYLYLTSSDNIPVEFNLDGVNTAIDEMGGPMDRRLTKCPSCNETMNGDSQGKALNGTEPLDLPDPSGRIKSAIGRELKAYSMEKRNGEVTRV
ncbi:hypothetical protein B0A49_04880 [Cryomyces minteri]|uniref:Formate/nitrite transporter n=1 Tax=Cryomyces minteri TaxID=331657 RepID=A0A4U0XL60_9PEZI|nr:hypothetical protein B0A49_04880 [Cryomyces minteri]